MSKEIEKAAGMTPAEAALHAYVDAQYEELCRDRYPEEREWFESGLFLQLRQWLQKDPVNSKVLRPMKTDGKKPWPMPVSNYFSQTIDLNSNSLGAAIPEMVAQPENYDAVNRRTAEAAERAIDEANRESGFNSLNPTLALHTALWGMGCTKDTIHSTSGTETVPTLDTQEIITGWQCPNCGYSVQNPQPQAVTGDEQGIVCPNCGRAQLQPILDEQQVPGIGTKIPTTRIKTEILTPFEIYTLRGFDPNESPQHIEHRPVEVGELRAQYPAFADKIVPEGKPEGNLSLYYLRTLQRLMAGSAAQEDNESKTICKTAWIQWIRLPKDVQEKIAQEWQNEPSDAYQKQGLSKFEAAQAYGIFGVFSCGLCLEMSENPYKGHHPYTFFLWKKDPASPYPMGLGVTLKPLQKQLNRLDSLIEKSLIANSAGKWIVPINQTRTDLTNDPNDVVQYDSDDGKGEPRFITTNPIAAACFQRRQTIVQEFQSLGYTTSLDTGDIPASAPFRALAFAGSKQDESRKTQRFLWELSHELRARKILELAKIAWDTPRKVKTAGYNNSIGFLELESADLEGDYEVNVIQDSSKPKTQTDKIQTVSMLLQGGLIDPKNPDVREYILDTLGETELDLIDHLAYVKAERDLEMLKQGIGPMETPYMHWDIELNVISEYTLTEEFEQLDQNIRAHILLWCQYCQTKLAPPPMMGPPPNAPPQEHPGAKAGKALAGPTPANVMHGIPGQNFSIPQIQQAANAEAQNFIQHLNDQPQAGA
jgi:hypothetical protein